MTHMIVLSSSDSVKYHLNNTVTDFITELVVPFHLKGAWEVALIDIHMSLSTQSRLKPINIYCDLCDESNVNGVLSPLLRHMPLTKVKLMQHLQFSTPIYVSLKTSEIKRVRMYIRDDHDDTPTQITDPLSCTLHIRKTLA